MGVPVARCLDSVCGYTCDAHVTHVWRPRCSCRNAASTVPPGTASSTLMSTRDIGAHMAMVPAHTTHLPLPMKAVSSSDRHSCPKYAATCRRRPRSGATPLLGTEGHEFISL